MSKIITPTRKYFDDVYEEYDSSGGWELIMIPKNDDDGRPYWIDWQIFRYYYDDGKRIRTKGHQLDNLPEVIVSGFIKWDGCCQFHSDNIHIDEQEEMESFTKLLLSIRDNAKIIFDGNEDW